VYLFLVLVADRYGMSFYGKEKTRRLCKLIDGDELHEILHVLAKKDLIARSDIYTQVLSLPQKPFGPGRGIVEEREISARPVILKEALERERSAFPVSVKEELAIYLRKDKSHEQEEKKAHQEIGAGTLQRGNKRNGPEAGVDCSD